MGKTNHKQKPLNRPVVSLDIRKAEILESDPIFAENMRGLNNSVRCGLAEPIMSRRIYPNLVMAAFRRAGLGLKESMQLLMA